MPPEEPENQERDRRGGRLDSGRVRASSAVRAPGGAAGGRRYGVSWGGARECGPERVVRGRNAVDQRGLLFV
ncbi:hypothetical protein SFR_5329 [Streptomyces sp. FR-008]|nr:hypothetical protein SFR_5329 [Streptomyces sp. FR-008]